MVLGASKKRKHVKLSEGDIFELALPDCRLGYGIIVKQGKLKNCGAPYVALFVSAHRERPDLTAIISDRVGLAGWTTDALFCHGHWTVLGRGQPIGLVPFPNFKVCMEEKVYATDVDGNLIAEATQEERELLDFQWSFSPVAYQSAFEALHGFGDWRERYDKMTSDYSRARMTRRI